MRLYICIHLATLASLISLYLLGENEQQLVQINLMSYIDNSMLIARSQRVENSLSLLRKAYGFIYRAFSPE
jgi:hypothetical protein